MKNATIALKLIFIFTILTGGVYPLAASLLGQFFFPKQAHGNLIEKDGRVIGSHLLAQKFTQEGYFWSRPSAIDYNPLPSGGTNLSPISKKLADSAKAQREKYRADSEVPQDLIFASASGLDPDVTPDSARIQVDRIVQARGWGDEKRQRVLDLIQKTVISRQFGILGEKRVNVLALNLALDALE